MLFIFLRKTSLLKLVPGYLINCFIEKKIELVYLMEFILAF